MERYQVTGMSCAACSARVEKAVSCVSGVDSVSVNLLTNSMMVEGTAFPEEIIEAVEKAGYGASVLGSQRSGTSNSGGSRDAVTGANTQESMLEDRDTPILKKRLIVSVVFLVILMYFSMGNHMFGFPLPKALAENPLALGLLQMLLSGIIMVINQRFFVSGVKGAVHRSPNMDTLVALGAGAAFIYSLVVLFLMTSRAMAGDISSVHELYGDMYFESAGTILTLITVGKLLESRSKGKTTNAIKALMKLSPKTALLIRDHEECEVPVEQIGIGDLFAVRPGMFVPVDGIIMEGGGAVDESALTGESIPVDKAEGDPVSAATINKSGYFICRATRIGEDTTLSQIIRMVSDAAATKAPIAKIADQVSGVFVPIVIVIAALTFLIWIMTGASVGYALARAISVLVISCPCALGLATPVAIMVGNGKAASNGILFKSAAILEETGKIETIAIDKTGTITAGIPVVTDVYPVEGIDENILLGFAGLLEEHSEHPLAKAVMSYVAENHITGLDSGKLTSFEVLPGNGLSGLIGLEDIGELLSPELVKKIRETAELKLDQEKVCVPLYGGSFQYLSQRIGISMEMTEASERMATEGATPVFFALGEELLGCIGIADVIRDESAEAIKQLQSMGLQVVMLTGDNEKTAAAIARKAGVDRVIAGVKPDGKARAIRDLQKDHIVAMVGDGINDAPALTCAEVGIAIGAGTDVAIDAADIVLSKSSLMDVAAAIRLSRATLLNIKENLFWAFIYNVIGIPLAAGVWISLLGWELNPMFGAAAMSLSSFCVVTNALRLNLLKIYDPSGDRRKKNKSKVKKEEETKMTKTIEIKGMMCPHCEASVRDALGALPQVEDAQVSHVTGTAVVTLAGEISDEELGAVVTGKGYEVVSIK